MGSQLESGSVQVSPTATTEYTLTATRESDTVTAHVTVTVGMPAVTIHEFTADETTIQDGSSTTLRWRTSHATAVTINGAAVTANGSLSVSPTVDTIYELQATGEAGRSPKG